ncbi:cysteine-rich receptor-like protein kinase 6 [Triticum aestivum]|uniref:cysteine-rich receptor-like protein kinase 6 n=1 Tax=Triticum aestivum TaxID=4565 RepID=UPI001D026A5B|nr:cysteine-rich receptor-like protein kinase 6 [Triticum aestivum]
MAIILLLLLSCLTPFQEAAADAFCDNVKVLAATLPNKTSSSPVHFATTTVGQAPDIVYALALCRGDILNDTACSQSVANTFGIVRNATPPDMECYGGTRYYAEYSILLYNFNDILAPSIYTNSTGDENGGDPPFERWNVKNVTGDVPLVAGLIRELLVETVEKAASATPRRFATGVMDSGTTFPKVYSLAQCTPDLSTGDCLACLNHLLGLINSTMSLRMGGQMGVIRCYFRYEASPFYQGQPMISLGPPAPTPGEHKRRMSKLWIIAIVLVPVAAAAFLFFILYSRRLTKQRKGTLLRLQGSRRSQDLEGEEELVWQGGNSEFMVFDFEQLLEATNNFSEENKLGQGGFGPVYKGKLTDGLEIAVKRLASHSGQGFTEFKNEVQLIAKLQHSNLVRLLGCCYQDEEKILVYEYLPNKSLNPKISDFGLAKIFSSNTEGNTTTRVVGTYGYMAPEYASQGVFSIKSDVFSFGVIIFEILSGKRNSGNQQYGDFINLLGYAWQLWDEGRWIDLVSSSSFSKSHSTKMMRCINIALLCVQENAADRPTMADVIAMLSNEAMIIDEPKQPAYFNVRVGNEETSTATESCSINDMTISATLPR